MEELSNNIITLSNMLQELLKAKNDKTVMKYQKPTDTEIRRLMLVLRQETLKLDKKLKYPFCGGRNNEVLYCSNNKQVQR